MPALNSKRPGEATYAADTVGEGKAWGRAPKVTLTPAAPRKAGPAAIEERVVGPSGAAVTIGQRVGGGGVSQTGGAGHSGGLCTGHSRAPGLTLLVGAALASSGLIASAMTSAAASASSSQVLAES